MEFFSAFAEEISNYLRFSNNILAGELVYLFSLSTDLKKNPMMMIIIKLRCLHHQIYVQNVSAKQGDSDQKNNLDLGLDYDYDFLV